MKKVWCVVGQENVWANIQQYESPAQLESFDFDNKKHWQPFLTSTVHKVHIGEGLVQNNHVQKGAPDIIYTDPEDHRFITKIENEIKKLMTGRFEDERIKTVKKTTSWNVKLGKDLHQVLGADGQIENQYLNAVDN